MKIAHYLNFIVSLLILLGIPYFVFQIPYRLAALKDHQYVLTIDKEKNMGYVKEEGLHIIAVDMNKISHDEVWKRFSLLDEERDDLLELKAYFEFRQKKFPQECAFALALLSVFNEDYRKAVKFVPVMGKKEAWHFLFQGERVSFFEKNEKDFAKRCEKSFTLQEKKLIILLELLSRLNMTATFKRTKSYLQRLVSSSNREILNKLLSRYQIKSSLWPHIERRRPGVGLRELEHIVEWKEEWELWCAKSICHLQEEDLDSFEQTIKECLKKFSWGHSPLKLQKLPGCTDIDFHPQKENVQKLCASALLLYDGLGFFKSGRLRESLLESYLESYYLPAIKNISDERLLLFFHRLLRHWLLESIWRQLANGENKYNNLFNLLEAYYSQQEKDPLQTGWKNFQREYHLLYWYLASKGGVEEAAILSPHIEKALGVNSSIIDLPEIVIQGKSQPLVPGLSHYLLSLVNK